MMTPWKALKWLFVFAWNVGCFLAALATIGIMVLVLLDFWTFYSAK